MNVHTCIKYVKLSILSIIFQMQFSTKQLLGQWIQFGFQFTRYAIGIGYQRYVHVSESAKRFGDRVQRQQLQRQPLRLRRRERRLQRQWQNRRLYFRAFLQISHFRFCFRPNIAGVSDIRKLFSIFGTQCHRGSILELADHVPSSF